jgi:hypothetical protein
MVKRIILVFLSFILLSCGAARKVAINKSNIISNIDSTSNEKKESVTIKNNYVSVTTDTDELEVVPIDSTKPILINDKAYFNATIRYKKTKTVLLDTTKTKVSEKALKSVSVKKKDSAKISSKTIDKKSNLLWWILIIILFIVGRYAYKKYALKYLSL